MNLALSAQERLDINLTSSFAEVFATTLNIWSKEGKNVLQKARGTYAPYRISNRTGASILVWSEADSGDHSVEVETTPVHNSQTIDWRFDDWKTTREVQILLSFHNLGLMPYSIILFLGNTCLVYSLSTRAGNRSGGFPLVEKENLFIYFALKLRSTRSD